MLWANVCLPFVEPGASQLRSQCLVALEDRCVKGTLASWEEILNALFHHVHCEDFFETGLLLEHIPLVFWVWSKPPALQQFCVSFPLFTAADMSPSGSLDSCGLTILSALYLSNSGSPEPSY